MKAPDIVFIQQYSLPYFGVQSLMSYLKHHGYTSEVVIDTLEKDIINTLKKLKPELIGFSVMSTEHLWLIDKIKEIKENFPGIKIIVGGVHAIFYSEVILNESLADMVCHSEGEEVLLNVIEAFRKPDSDLKNIKGIVYRDNGKVCMNERADLVAFNDDIIEDKSKYYDRYPELLKDGVHRFFSSRGCPFRCSFCYNSNIHDLFKGKGRYIRQKTVDNFMQEIILQHKKYPIQSIFFYDDLFTFDPKWLKEFLKRYKKEINKPFMCTTRANLVDKDMAKMLKEAGCQTISYGIETGNENLRKRVLNKHISDEQIINAGKLFYKYGIKTQTANMFCLPEETVKDALNTIDINIKAKTCYAFSALFMPFPDTEISDYCIKNGFLKPDYSIRDMPASFAAESVLILPEKTKKAIKNIHYLMFFFVKYPFLFEKFKKIVNLTFLMPLFYLVFLLGTFVRYKEEKGVSIIASLYYAWRMRKSI